MITGQHVLICGPSAPLWRGSCVLFEESLSIVGPVAIRRRIAELKRGMNTWGERLIVITPVRAVEGSIVSKYGSVGGLRGDRVEIANLAKIPFTQWRFTASHTWNHAVLQPEPEFTRPVAGTKSSL
jgi:hypothetical protein